MPWNKSLFLSGLFLTQITGGVSASQYSCPPVGSTTFLDVQTSSVVALSNTENVGEVCILYLVSPKARQPIARSYDGRNWEKTAGKYAGRTEEPTCTSAGSCSFTLPVDAGTLGYAGEYKYALTSYSHSTTREAEVARFLEQSTFGTTKNGISALSVTTTPDGSPNFSNWVEHQLDSTESGAGVSAHREFWRSHTNPRFEYPTRAGGAGPASACEISSRWRKFALTERDGLLDWKSRVSKWLHFKAVGNRFIWFVEGRARTSTQSLGIMTNHKGLKIRDVKVTDMFRIGDGTYIQDNMKYSCVGCPVQVCDVWGTTCGYIENPKVDMVGILGTARYPYSLVQLPNIMAADGKMISIDDGPYLQNLMEYQQPNDEFQLNTAIDQSQCAGHPSTLMPLPSLFTGTLREYHVESAAAPIFGRTTNAETGQVEYMLFDPVFKFLENTVENPLPDGGGKLFSESDGEVFCANVARSFYNEDHCKLSLDPMACGFGTDGKAATTGAGTVVCGSPGEVASDPSNGVIDGYDLKTIQWAGFNREIYTDNTFTAQKFHLWYHLALNAMDQLRQRMAWALYQIVPISVPSGHVPMTENWLVYYDVFVRNAFGNYRNILKEVSYVDLMADWLSYMGNKAIQYQIDNNVGLHYPDENYAREIMQLFSIGVVQLNMDGTHKLDANGTDILTYDSSDIMNYARAWTGFERSGWRGNHEAEYRRFSSERIDPMVISRDSRDIFPKSDLKGGFIGDGYPLCVDLPDKDFLRKGATYRLLGNIPSPELQFDDFGSGAARLALAESSPLYTKLCAPNAQGVCTFPGKVVLDESLLYNQAAQDGAEYQVDTIRSVRIQANPFPIYYEYVRPPCVHQNFFNDGKKILAGQIGSDKIVRDSMCADPRTYLAADTCCGTNWETVWGDSVAYRNCAYNGERMRYNSAVNRCLDNGQALCNPRKWAADVCMDTTTYAWSSVGCSVKVKIAFEKEHNIARVDYPEADWAGERIVKNFVSDGTINYFKVPFSGNTENIPEEKTQCDPLVGCYSVDDGCVCDTTVVEVPVFDNKDEISSKDDICDKLNIGAFSPDIFDAGVYISLGNCGIEGVEVYSKNGGDCYNFNSDTIFHYTNEFGVKKYMKNMESIVLVTGIDGISFRNPVHFIDFADRSLRDMYQETDAVIDSYFYHPTHAPFLAIRILQRFGISNPSPSFVKRVATAYKEGMYQDRFGSGEYGDLGALIAAVLLDPEARAISLDADPAHGHVREPVLKITSFLRSMDTEFHAPLSIPFMPGKQTEKLGQGPYRSLSVFSFFLPEFQPSGVIADSGLVSPESNVLDVRLLNLINGLFSTVKFGLSWCNDGFGDKKYGAPCPKFDGLIAADALGTLRFSMDSTASMDDILDELSLLLTSSRLGANNREIIKQVAEEAYNSGDKEKAIRIAQQLIAATPEFHTTNLAQKTEIERPMSGYSIGPKHKYRSVVFFMMTGGADSYNLIVPKSNCDGGRNVYQEYKTARQGVALTTGQLLDIDATSSGQICKTFGVNNNFPLLQKLYAQGKGLFFANTGVLTKPMTKFDNWKAESKVQLFAHNHMQQENYGMDPLKKKAGTGVGGRMMDLLKREGYHTSSNMVDGAFKFSKGFASDNSPTWNVATFPLKTLDAYSSVGPTMLKEMKRLNGEGDSGNSVYGETFSARLSQDIFEYEEGLQLDEAMKNGDIDMSKYPLGGELINGRLRAVAQFMRLRETRKVDRDVFIVTHDGYDHHKENGVGAMFEEANDALHEFVDDLIREGLWEDTVIIMGSDFGRSITTNSNGGTDHAWGGNYFMIGGSVNGGKILGEYPRDLSDKSSQWIMRGRMIPTTGWDQIWNGVAQWMGVRGDNDLDELLPNRGNFGKCSLYTDKDLFVDGHFAHSTCGIDDSDGDGVPDAIDQCPDTKYEDLDFVDTIGCINGETPTPSPPPTQAPTPLPTNAPPTVPTAPTSVTQSPTPVPTKAPTNPPTPLPTNTPTASPTNAPTPIPAPTLAPIASEIPVTTILTTGTTVVRLGGSHNKNPLQAIDGNTVKFLVVKDGTMAPGAQFTPTWPKTVVTGMRIYTANDAKARDPASYVLEGRTSAGSPWQEISSGDLNLPDLRNPEGNTIDSTKYHQEIFFSNDLSFFEYRLTFPETKSSISGIMQIAEVELPGRLIPFEVIPTVSPTNNPTETPTQSPTPAPITIDLSNAVANVISPGSPNYLVGTTYTDWVADKAFDGIVSNMGIPVNGVLSEHAGFVVTLSTPSVVKGIRVYASNNWPSRDPMSYELHGRNSEDDDWSLISVGSLNLPEDRNIADLPINSSFETPDMSLQHDGKSFDNAVAFLQYKVNFPTTRADDIGVVIGEVELPGYLVSEGPVSPTTPPPSSTQPPTPVPTQAQTNASTPVPTNLPTISPTNSPTIPPTNPPTPVPTIAPTGGSTTTNPVATVLTTGTTVVRVGGYHTKPTTKVIDGNTGKSYMNKDGNGDPGFVFTPTQSSSVVTGMRIYTANDAIGRDPASYVLEGRADAGSAWIVISSGDLNLPDGRNPEGHAIISTATEPDFSRYHEEVSFTNEAAYYEYRLTFPSTKSVNSGGIQMAEVELPGYFFV